jgi:hypothetical protein
MLSFEPLNIPGYREALALGFKPRPPITLSPAQPFIAGKAALVFVSPHVIDASKDVVKFGFLTPKVSGGSNVEEPSRPHEGACAVAWFKPPPSVHYLVNFGCQTHLLDNADYKDETFRLVRGGASQSASYVFGGQYVAMIQGSSPQPDWESFRLSGSHYWQLRHCEITVLEKL